MFLMSFLNPIAIKIENPIDGMYKILSAITNPTFIIPIAGINGMIKRTRAVNRFLKFEKFLNYFKEFFTEIYFLPIVDTS